LGFDPVSEPKVVICHSEGVKTGVVLRAQTYAIGGFGQYLRHWALLPKKMEHALAHGGSVVTERYASCAPS
jgi:hypothetical protein